MGLISGIVHWFKRRHEEKMNAEYAEWIHALMEARKCLAEIIITSKDADPFGAGIELDIYKYPIILHSPMAGMYPNLPLQESALSKMRPRDTGVVSVVVECEKQLQKIPFHTNIGIPIAYSIFLPNCKENDQPFAILINKPMAIWYSAKGSLNNAVSRAILAHELGHVIYRHYGAFDNIAYRFGDKTSKDKTYINTDGVKLIKSPYGITPVIDDDHKELEADSYAIMTGHCVGMYMFFMISLYKIKYLHAKGAIDSIDHIEEHILMRIANILSYLELSENQVISAKKLAKLEDLIEQGDAFISILQDVDLVYTLISNKDIIGNILYFVEQMSVVKSVMDEEYAVYDPLIRAAMFDNVNRTKLCIQERLINKKSCHKLWDEYEEALYQWQYLCEYDEFDKVPPVIASNQTKEKMDNYQDLLVASKEFLDSCF